MSINDAYSPYRILGTYDKAALKNRVEDLLARRVQVAQLDWRVLDMFFNEGEIMTGIKLHNMYRHFLPDDIRTVYEYWRDDPRGKYLLRRDTEASIKFHADDVGTRPGFISFHWGREYFPAVSSTAAVLLNTRAQNADLLLEWARNYHEILTQNRYAENLLSSVITMCGSVGQLVRVMPFIRPFLNTEQQIAVSLMKKQSPLPEALDKLTADAIHSGSDKVSQWLTEGNLLPEYGQHPPIVVRLSDE